MFVDYFTVFLSMNDVTFAFGDVMVASCAVDR